MKVILLLVLFVPFISMAQTNVFNSTGNAGAGTTSPQAKLHIVDGGASLNTAGQYNGGLIIQSSTGGRTETSGAQLEFALPVNTDGSNIWGQARIITVAANTANANATGKLILGTRRWQNKLGSGNSWYYGDDLTIDGMGNVGIGTTSPQFKLDVDALATRIKNSATSYASYTSLRIQGAEYANGLEIDFFGQSNIPSVEWTYGAGVGGAAIVNVNPKPLVLGTANTSRMVIDGSGNVGIATNDTKGYRFAVNGDAIFNKIKVKQYPWADYVFDADYKLPSLQQVEEFIKQHKHLPDVPSAKEVQQNGLDIGDNQATLLRKIEELTLYIIAQDKKIEEQDKQIESQQNAIKDLKTQNKELAEIKSDLEVIKAKLKN